MAQDVESLKSTLEALGPLTPGQSQDLNLILTQVERYVRTAFSSSKSEKKGQDLTEPLDAAIKTAILMLESIDTINTGLDDALALELRKTYEKYLGTFKV